MPFDRESVNTLFVLRSLASTFKNLVEIREVAMVVAIETTFMSRDATCALLLPLIVKDRIANLLQSFVFGHPLIVSRCDWFLSVLHDCSSFSYRFLRDGRLSRSWAGSVFNRCQRRGWDVLVRHLHVTRCGDRYIPDCES